VHHACLGWRSLGGDAEYRWEFSEKGRDLEVAVRGPLISNDTELLVACAERDLGLAFVVESEARRELEAGALETALDDYATSVDGLFLYFPTSARGAPKLHALVQCARDVLIAQKAANARVRPSRKR
jgi:DNA-binding transcriptional LysR family regulator